MSNMRTGSAQLPLHGGKAPRWLFDCMARLANFARPGADSRTRHEPRP